MKTKNLLKSLLLSCLYLTTCLCGYSQEDMTRAHAAENHTELPALGCFSTSFAGLRFRNDWGLKEMMLAELAAIWQHRQNAILFSLHHYGYANYGDMRMGIGYGRSFGERFAMTGRVFYLMAHARGYPARHSLCTDFSIACKVSPKLLFAATAYNPFMLRYGIVGQEIIPLRFTLGCTYLPGPKLLASVSMAKSLPGEWEIDCRLLTQPIPPLLLSLGCSNARLGLFIGLLYRKFLISVEAAWYYRISVSPQIGGYYYPERRGER